jgi:hypothetical protein
MIGDGPQSFVANSLAVVARHIFADVAHGGVYPYLVFRLAAYRLKCVV